MSRLVLALIFFPLAALAEPCPQPKGIPCTPDLATKNEVINKFRDLIQKSDAVSAAERNWKKSEQGGDKEAAYEALRAFMDARAEVYRASDETIKFVEDAYNTAPVVQTGTAKKPAGGKMNWVEGLPAAWKPRFSFADFDYRRYTGRRRVHLLPQGLTTRKCGAG